MPKEKVGKIPEFTSDETLGETQEEVKQEEKETPSEPSIEEKPAEETSDGSEAEKTPEEETSEDTGEEPEESEELKAVQGLQEEKEKLLTDIRDLRGQRRDLRSEETKEVTAQAKDELKDLHPDDVKTIDRIIQARGYVSKDELNKKFYETVKQEELNKFLDKYPEFKPENDPEDKNWTAFQEELKYYRMPENPHQVSKVLEKARKSISVPSSDRSIAQASQKRMETAGVGAKGGASKASPLQSFDPQDVDAMSRGGFSIEEIKEILKNKK